MPLESRQLMSALVSGGIFPACGEKFEGLRAFAVRVGEVLKVPGLELTAAGACMD
jgi:hypothetical protein